jgi:hypothetical protein
LAKTPRTPLDFQLLNIYEFKTGYLFSRCDTRRGPTEASRTPSREATGYFEKQRQEHKLGLLLLAVSLLFIVCQSFKMVPDLYEVVFW